MPVKLYAPGKTNAENFARSGRINRDQGWNAPDDPKPIECLGFHDDATEGTKGRQAFPVFNSDGILCRAGVIAAKQRAAQQGDKEIENAADAILKLIDGHHLLSGTVMLGDTRIPHEVSLANGDPKHLWKELIRVGRFIHPVTKSVIEATPSRIKHWCDDGNAMIKSGVRVPINCDHNLSAVAGLGEMSGYEVRDGSLWGEMNPADEKAAEIIKRNDVSLGYLPSYTDGNGKMWQDQIYHVACTQLPVVTGLEKSIAASHVPAEWQAAIYLSAVTPPLGDIPMPTQLTDDHVKALRGCTHLCMGQIPDGNVPDHLSSWHSKHAEHLSALRRCVPGMETCSPGEELPRTAQHLSTIQHIQDKIRSTNPHLLSMNAGEAAGAIDAKIDEWAAAATKLGERDATITELRKQNVELSSHAVKDVPAEAVPFIKEALSAMKTKLIGAGAVPYAVDLFMNRAASADKVNAVLCSTAANPFGNDRALIFDLSEIILQMMGGPGMGSMTGGQQLSRTSPTSTLHDNDATKAAMAAMTGGKK